MSIFRFFAKRIKEENKTNFGNYNILIGDPVYTEIVFSLYPLTFPELRIKFTNHEIKLHGTPPDYEDLCMEMHLPISGIKMQSEALEEAIKELFGAKSDRITFKCDKFILNSNKTIDIFGKLTINGITKRVRFYGKLIGMLQKDPRWLVSRISLELKGSINRSDFGLLLPDENETGKIFKDEMKIEMKINLSSTNIIDIYQKNGVIL